MRASSLLVWLCMLTAGSPAGAVEAVVLPAQPLAADGTRVHVLKLYVVDGDKLIGASSVRAAHGAVVGDPVPADDGGLSIRYRPPRVGRPGGDTLHVIVGGRDLPVEVSLAPPGRTQLQLEVSPDPLLLGRGATAEVKLHVRDPSGRPVRAPLRLGASVGKVTPLAETALGEYRATYTAPDDRYPQVAILAALSITDGAFAARALKLAARVPLEGQGEPGASMQVMVDGRAFGPVVVDEQGHFNLPLVVPPGGHAIGLSTDPMGNQRRREIDLALPPFPRLVLAAVPNTLPADGHARAEVVAFAVDARGNPERKKVPELVADRGTLSPPQARGDGVWSWSFTAPWEVGTAPVLIHAAQSATRIALKPAPPFHLELLPPEPLPAGSAEPAEIGVRVVDESGSPVAGAELQATLQGGRVVGVREVGNGSYAVRVVPPRDPGRGLAALHVELGSLVPGAPRRVTLHAARAKAGRVAAEAWVDDDLGLPVPGTTVAFHMPDGSRQEVVSDRYGVARLEIARPATRQFRIVGELPGLEAALDALEVGGTLYTVPSTAGRGVVETHDAPPGASLDAEVPLQPAVPVDLRVRAEPARTRAGQPVRILVTLRGQGKLAWQASGGTLEAVRPLDAGSAELRFTPPADARSGSHYFISVTDEKSRVTAFAEVTIP